MTHAIHPEPYRPTEKDHQLAYLKWCMERLVWDELLRIDMDRRDFPKVGWRKRTWKQKLGLEPPTWEKDLQRLLDRFFRVDSDSEAEPWECFWAYDDFKKTMTEDLAGNHAGDCTAIACPCGRCHAEDLYGYPSTVTWAGKSEGWRLYNEWRRGENKKMLDPNTHYVDRDAWKKVVASRPFRPKGVSTEMQYDWDVRTSGSGYLAMTLLYALRAHMRGKVHCRDMSLEQQGAWLAKAMGFLSPFLVPRGRRRFTFEDHNYQVGDEIVVPGVVNFQRVVTVNGDTVETEDMEGEVLKVALTPEAALAMS